MSNTTAVSTVLALSKIFATHGLPEFIVSDNGPQLTSGDFADFCKAHGIKHILTAPYHPQSNGLAERFVQTFKNFLKKTDNSKYLDLHVNEFLLSYRSIQHPATNKSPAEILMGRKLRTNCDLSRPVKIIELVNVASYEERMERNFNKKSDFASLKTAMKFGFEITYRKLKNGVKPQS